jgi:hypothetical protein
MGQKFLLAWAVAASALALLLLGILIGRSTGTDPNPVRAAGDYEATRMASEGPDAGAVAGPDYSIPDVFQGLPKEWRTGTDGETFDGYAIWFDPERREVIVEQCLHRGYVTEDGAPLDTNYEFCEGVLWASILDIGAGEATVRTQTGEVVELDLALSEDAGQLSLSFPGHDMTLVPGSKNDLLQAMDNAPRMVSEKQQAIEVMQAQYQERLRAQQAAERDGEQDIPTYTLPAAAEERTNE